MYCITCKNHETNVYCGDNNLDSGRREKKMFLKNTNEITIVAVLRSNVSTRRVRVSKKNLTIL